MRGPHGDPIPMVKPLPSESRNVLRPTCDPVFFKRW
jgi:hypothetical protein